ncbi:MAG: ROK family protein [Deltaproteobacteria bacterium]|nr:ROK family protein [Deltaproteobacteria bacterium]
MTLAIGIDVGGTNIRGGVVDETGKILKRARLSSDSRLGKGHFLNQLKKVVDELGVVAAGPPLLQGIAIGLPGIVDPAQGIVYASPHFEDWKNWNAVNDIEKLLGRRPEIDNDANFAVLGEGWLGAAKEWPHYLMITLGTGIGGGIVIDKKVWHGDRGFAGEFGHIIVETEGPRCFCGGRGCLEMFASATGLKILIEEAPEAIDKRDFLRLCDKEIEGITMEEVYRLAQDGNSFAISLFKRVGFYLGVGIASLVNTLGMERVVIGGGIRAAWDFFIGEAKKEVGKRTYKETAARLQIVPSALGDDAGILGAAARVFTLS